MIRRRTARSPNVARYRGRKSLSVQSLILSVARHDPEVLNSDDRLRFAVWRRAFSMLFPDRGNPSLENIESLLENRDLPSSDTIRSARLRLERQGRLEPTDELVRQYRENHRQATLAHPPRYRCPDCDESFSDHLCPVAPADAPPEGRVAPCSEVLP